MSSGLRRLGGSLSPDAEEREGDLAGTAGAKSGWSSITSASETEWQMIGVVWPDDSFDLLCRSDGEVGTEGGNPFDFRSVFSTGGSGNMRRDGVGPTSA